MSNDLNNLSVYEYIVARNPEKAIEFLSEKGFKSSGGARAAQAYANAKHILGKNLLDTLASSRISDGQKQTALYIVRDAAGKLQEYANNGREPALKEIIIRLHPDVTALKSLFNTWKSLDANDFNNCCGKMNADGQMFEYAGTNQSGSYSNAANQGYMNAVPLPMPNKKGTVLDEPKPDHTILYLSLTIIGIIAIIKLKPF